MKKLNCLHVVALGAFLATAGITGAHSQTTSETTTSSTTTSAGTVSDFTPSVITVRSESSSSPVSYSYSKTTTYVDENGNPVSQETVRSGAPVTVYYTQDGSRMMASKVVVHRSVTETAAPAPAPDPAPVVQEEKKTTTTTTTTGQ